MKPPRVIDHKGYFYIAYYLPGQKHAIKEPVGEKVDVPKGTGNWWKKSKHRTKIRILIEDAQARKLRYKQGHEFERTKHRTVVIRKSLLEIAEEYTREREVLKGYIAPPNTVLSRLNAVGFLYRFDKHIPLQITQQHVLELREWALKEYEPSTVRTYFTKLFSIYEYALRKKYVRMNPFKDVGIEVKQKEIRHVPREDQVKVFDRLYKKDPEKFWQIMFIRLSGFRVSEVCNLEKANIEGSYIVTGKVKRRGRVVKYPITAQLTICIDNAGDHGKYIFKERSRHQITQPIEYTCIQVGIPIWGAHQLKRDYADEVGKLCRRDPYLKNMMSHHRPHWMTAVADMHYIGDDLKLMKKTAEKAQVFWLDYLREKVKTG